MKFVKSARNTNIKTDDGKPCRIQLPSMRVMNKNEFGKIELEVQMEFLDMWNPINDAAKEHAKHKWNDNPKDGKFRVQVDEKSMIFNSHAELEDVDYVDKFVICMIELKSVYNFKDQSGITLRVHQMKVSES